MSGVRVTCLCVCELCVCELCVCVGVFVRVYEQGADVKHKIVSVPTTMYVCSQ